LSSLFFFTQFGFELFFESHFFNSNLPLLLISLKTGIFYIILSGLSFLVVNFFVKLFGIGPSNTVIPGLQKIPAHELVLARSLISFGISSSIIVYRGLPFFGNNKKWLTIRGISGMLALTIFFQSIQHMPIAVASTVQYLAPIFTMIFALFILKERILKIQWFFVLMAFSGVFLIGFNNLFQTESSVFLDPFWLGFGVLSAAFSGIAYVAIVKLKETDKPINIVSYFPMLAIPVMSFWCLFDFVMPNGIEWLILLVIGICTQIAQISLTRALHYESSSLIMPFQYLGSVYALLVGYLVLDERLNTVVICGVFIILLGVILNTIVKAAVLKSR
jgi:drug/metabolite transporter (DMT)-like permease